MRYFAGLDVSLDETALCVVDDEGTIVREGKARSEPEALIAWLADVGLSLEKIGLEAAARCRRGFSKVCRRRGCRRCVSRRAE